MTNIHKTAKAIAACLLLTSGLFISSCGTKDPNSAGYEFMPDMYRSPSYETNIYTVNANGDTIMANLQPVAGTVARGYMPYPYANDTAGYRLAGLYLRNPLANNELNTKAGEELYGKYCVHCHGATGGGDGAVGAKLPGAPPAYSGTLKDLPEGKIFHSITYGKGLMGPHAQMLTAEERWKITLFVQKLQYPNGRPGANTAAAPADTAKAAVPAVEEKKI